MIMTRTSDKNLRLVLFFTDGISLKYWEQTGILEREVALYQKLQKQGIHVSFVTYGNDDDLQYKSQFPGIQILCNRWKLSSAKYKRWLYLLHAPWLWRSHIIKTNQTCGADVALQVSRIWRKPLITRCGYMWSNFVARDHGEHSHAYKLAYDMENRLFTTAHQVVVTTPAMAAEIRQRLSSEMKHIRVIPNYVNTDIFCPQADVPKDFDIVFVGRLVPQKNLSAFLEAIAPLKIRVLLIGDGYLRKQLQHQFASLQNRIKWQTHIPNTTLPRYLNRAKLFILPSLYEGHPKALIEAMACGLSIIGANSPGIRELIHHGENGWLCETHVESIRNAVSHLLTHPLLRESLGETARQYVMERFSLHRITEVELTMLKEIVNR